MANLIGCQLVLTCQRTGCDVQEALEISGRETVAGRLDEAVLSGEIEAGWGWDTNGADTVFHCPEHRT